MKVPALAFAALLIAALAHPLKADEKPKAGEKPPAVSRVLSDFARQAMVRALFFKQGDLDSFQDAQSDFTKDGWAEYIKQMAKLLNEKGAPLQSSNFMPAGDSTVIKSDDSHLHEVFQGILRQGADKTAVAYRAAVEVEVAGTPPKVEHLHPRTCGLASEVPSCRY